MADKYESPNCYSSPYQKEETEDLIRQVNELLVALGACWALLPDGDYGQEGVKVKNTLTKYGCWPTNPPHAAR